VIHGRQADASGGQREKEDQNFMFRFSKGQGISFQIRKYQENVAYHHLPIKHVLYNIANIINKFFMTILINQKQFFY
jgi:hypothetical protein